MSSFIPFPAPTLDPSSFEWVYVNQPAGRTNRTVDTVLRERSLVLKPTSTAPDIAYEGFGRELDTFMLNQQISPGGQIFFTRGKRVNLR